VILVAPAVSIGRPIMVLLQMYCCCSKKNSTSSKWQPQGSPFCMDTTESEIFSDWQ